MKADSPEKVTKPILLYNDECAVCRHIAHWVQRLAQDESGRITIIERPIGDDPDEIQSLNPQLDIWDAYATIHLLMPDGSMKLGGEAVAEVLRNLPDTEWLARSFSIRIFGVRPFQTILNLGYEVLSDVRPLFGCESCGTPTFWVRPIAWISKRYKAIRGEIRHPSPTPHFSPRLIANRRPITASN